MGPTSASTDLAVVTPIWEPDPSPQVLSLLRITNRHASATPRIFLAPRGLDVSRYCACLPDWEVRFRDPRHFASVESYSASLLEPEFYESFADYAAIVLCQLDAVLLKDPAALSSIDTDYLGAPWRPPIRVIWWRKTWLHERWAYRAMGKRLRVGNGGLSMRRPSAFVGFTQRLRRRRDYPFLRDYNEDMVVSYFGGRYGLRIAPSDVAARVFMEGEVQGLESLPDVYGLHGVERLNPGLYTQLLASI